jgi:SAM-dependent methyltransferase
MVKASLDEGWEEVGCILCGFGSKIEIFWRDVEGGNIVRCSQCGLAYRSPRRPEEYLTRYFEEEWTEPLALEKSRTYILRKIAEWVLERHCLPGAILDIGSGSGNLLAQFPETWNRFGVEPSKAVYQFAKRLLPEANIINASFTTANLPKECFDVITMIGTIYYLPQPLRDLARIRGLLKPEGIALIESPNFTNRGYVYRWLNHKFSEAWVYFYTPKTMDKIINKIGMQVVDRIDLPGHRITSSSLPERVISWRIFCDKNYAKSVFRKDRLCATVCVGGQT